MTNEEIYFAIKNGTHQDQYESWKSHENASIRAELAGQGYFPETFINDEDGYVVYRTLERYPSNLLYVAGKTGMQYAYAASLYFSDDVNVSKDVLDAYINREDAIELVLDDILVKREAIDYQLTEEEKKMSLFDRYISGSLAWAKDLNCNQISAILNLDDKTREEFERLEDLWKIIYA